MTGCRDIIGDRFADDRVTDQDDPISSHAGQNSLRILSGTTGFPDIIGYRLQTFSDIIGYRFTNDRVTDQNNRISSHGRQDVQISSGIVLQTIGLRINDDGISSHARQGSIPILSGWLPDIIRYRFANDMVTAPNDSDCISRPQDTARISSGIVSQTIRPQIKMIWYHDRIAARDDPLLLMTFEYHPALFCKRHVPARDPRHAIGALDDTAVSSHWR
ncbi:hypothetical protein BS47DRAFT_1400306 [Hydnum rufescens UP504]|uniref:Uncharacterized protein n=1 Tax=Hydnum rufescens UP504 TaxID=1448309 RepID=A0A9P6DL24_9AGAM|nr:hypothetical protein BS47DRAFT_1400306 [Hydnum rufescens UP504]